MKRYEKIKTRRGTIAGRNIRSLVFLGLFLILAVCLIAGRVLYRRDIRVYTEHVYAYAHLLADNISGSTPTRYMQTQTEDEDYGRLSRAFEAAGGYWAEFRDVYLVVPTQEDLIYLCEVRHNLPEGKRAPEDSAALFLEHRPYREGEREIMLRALSGAEEKLYIGPRTLGGEKLATALVPLRTAEGEYPALVGVDVSISAVWDALMKLFVILALTITLITCGGIGLHYRILERTLIQPITALKQGADSLAERMDSDEDFVSDIHTGDEIEALAHSLEDMDRSLRQKTKQLVAVTAEQERLNTELTLAAEIQRDMLPRDFPPFPERDEFELYAAMDPAREVGGDFYDFFLIDEDHLALVIADVSGKGIPAALFMMMVKIAVKNCVLAGLGAKQALEQVNRLLAENNSESMFVTVWLGILDIPSGKLDAVNAGHEYPILKQPGGAYTLFKDRHGMAVGAMEGIRYRSYELALEAGSRLFVYSDGLPEANNSAEELFGLDRTLDALNAVPDASPEETLRAVRRAVDAFVGQAPQFDDLTMLCLLYHGPRTAAQQTEEGEIQGETE